jgi:acyl-CoA thioesterase FadM
VIDVRHRPQHDGTVWETPHLAFYEVLEAVAQANRELLESTGRPDLTLQNFALVHVSSDFRHEMFVGELVIRATVTQVGSSSVTVEALLIQNGRETGRVRSVLVHVSSDRAGSVSLTDEQREALAPASIS